MPINNDFTQPRSKRSLDVVTGMDAFEPTDLELQDEQVARGQASYGETGGSYGFIPSRESLRESKMQELRRALGLSGIQHQQEMEKELLPIQVKGQYDVAASQNADLIKFLMQNANNEASMNRLGVQQGGMDRRAGSDAGLRRELAKSGQEAAMNRTKLIQGEISKRSEADKPFQLFQWLGGLLGGGADEPASEATPSIEEGFNEFDVDPTTGQLIPRR